MYLTPGFIGFCGTKLYQKHVEWLKIKHKFYKPNGQPIPEKQLSQEELDEKHRYQHPQPHIGVAAGVEIVVPPTWMHSQIHAMVLINILMMLLLDKKDPQWGDIVATLKKQYGYLQNGDIVACGEEVLQFARKFSLLLTCYLCLFLFCFFF